MHRTLKRLTMRNASAALRRIAKSRRVVRLAAAAFCLTLAGGLSLAGAAAAHAAGSDRIDVGLTISQNGYWKGSGSYSNYNNTYGHVCVRIYLLYTIPVIGVNVERHTVRCVATPQGGGFAFSAPNMQCGNYGAASAVLTEVAAYGHDANSSNGNLGSLLATKDSNIITPATC
jgi:hypothetical protein